MKGRRYPVFILLVCFVLVYSFFFHQRGFAQEKSDSGRAALLDSKIKTEVIEGINKHLVKKYIFLETAEKMKELLVNKLKNGDYAKIDDVNEFSLLLTEDLRSVSKDKHIRVVFDPDLVQRIRDYQSQSEEDRQKAKQERLKSERFRNFGYQKLEILEGNIGYLIHFKIDAHIKELFCIYIV